MPPVGRYYRFWNRKVQSFTYPRRRWSELAPSMRKEFHEVVVEQEEPVEPEEEAYEPVVILSRGSGLSPPPPLPSDFEICYSPIPDECDSSVFNSSASTQVFAPDTDKEKQCSGSTAATSDESAYFVPVPAAQNGHPVTGDVDDEELVSGTPPLASADIDAEETTAATNGTSQTDVESDDDEAMPEPMQSNHNVKLITLDSEKSLVVVDPVTFTSEVGQIALISGCVTMQLIHGNVQLNGYELRTGLVVKACTGGSNDFVLIEGSEIDQTNAEKLTAAIRSEVDPKFSAKVIREISSYDNFPKLTVLLISKWSDYRFSLIKSHMSSRLPDPQKLSEKPFFNLTFTKNASCIGSDWMPLISHRFLSKLSNESVLMVTGPSESGKSVLLKRIVNVIMSAPKHNNLSGRILFVDLDPGQSEFSAPAQLTAVQISFQDQPLISRPYAHSILFNDRVIAATSVGSIDLNQCASTYVRAIEHLMAKVRQHLKDDPCAVFVNTSGFIRGLGRSLLIDAIRIVQPTDVIEIKETLDNSNDCRFDVIFGPRARGFATSLKSHPCVQSYSYMDLMSTKKRNRSKSVNLKNRESQILSVLSQNPNFLLTPLSQLDRLTVDLEKVIHFTRPNSISIPEIADKLHHAFVQLVDIDESVAENGARGLCVTKDLRSNNVISYGILFVSRDAAGKVAMEVAAVSEIVQNVPCIVVPGGLSLPSSLLV